MKPILFSSKQKGMLISAAALLILLTFSIASTIQAVENSSESAFQGVPVVAQLTATPITVQINSPTPLPEIIEAATPTFTPAEELSTLPMLEANASAGEVNVRFEANIDSELVGTIGLGEQYAVTGRFQQWYRIAFEESPDGTGWVFNELVTVISGDINTVPDLAQTPLPTTDATSEGATQTAAVLILTPGAALTATANVREISGPVAAVNADGTTVADPLGTELSETTPLPTFTYPPEVALQVTDDPGATGLESTTPPPLTLTPDDVPPILPIAVLGGFGLLGLAVASLRR